MKISSFFLILEQGYLPNLKSTSNEFGFIGFLFSYLIYKFSLRFHPSICLLSMLVSL